MINESSPQPNHALAYAANGGPVDRTVDPREKQILEPCSNSAALRQFLRAILPANGLKCAMVLCGERRRHYFFATTEELADFLLWQDSLARTGYHACASFKTAANRKQLNVFEVRSLWGDIDTREGKPDAPYADRQEAFNALLQFCKASGMPMPVFVSSGYGLHVYWPLIVPLPEVVWRVYANRLAKLFEKHDLKVDPSRTQDSASILRPPGTHNRKNGGCVPVECGQLVGPYRIEDLPLGAVVEALPDAQGSTRPSRPLTRPRGTIIDRILHEDPPPWSEAEEAWIRSMLAYIPAVLYDDWLEVGMALHWLGWGERGYQIWCEWSRTVPEKYSESAQHKKWESFR
jgi:Primase C terminal 2 (PriCT-2)